MENLEVTLDISINDIGKKVEITEQMVTDGLYDICSSVHSHCSNACPVFKLNNGIQPGHDKPFEENRGCDCFKNGTSMLKFIKENS